MCGWIKKKGEICSKASIFLCVWTYMCMWNQYFSRSVYSTPLSTFLCVFKCGMCMSRNRRLTVIVADALYSVSHENVSGICGKGVDSWLCAKDSRANCSSIFPAKISGAVHSMMEKALLLMRVRKDGGEKMLCKCVCVCVSVSASMHAWCDV